MGVEFRAANRADLDGMANLFTKHSPEERLARMEKRYRADSRGWYVAVLDGQVAGCCQAVFPRASDGWLQWMRIAPNCQGNGIGGGLSDYVEQQAVRQGANILRLSTLSTNDRVHHLMGGMRGYTEWARWTRLTGVQPEAVRRLQAGWHETSPAEMGDAEDVLDWLRKQTGYGLSFAGVTCPSDFKKIVSLDDAWLSSLLRSGGRSGCIVARRGDAIDGVALYAALHGEFRVLQVVAASTAGGMAAVAGALQQARRKERLSVQWAGATAELEERLSGQLDGSKSKRHDFYVFGKRVR